MPVFWYMYNHVISKFAKLAQQRQHCALCIWSVLYEVRTLEQLSNTDVMRNVWDESDPGRRGFPCFPATTDVQECDLLTRGVPHLGIGPVWFLTDKSLVFYQVWHALQHAQSTSISPATAQCTIMLLTEATLHDLYNYTCTCASYSIERSFARLKALMYIVHYTCMPDQRQHDCIVHMAFCAF